MSTSSSAPTVAASSVTSKPYTERELSLILLGEGHHIAFPSADRYVDIPLVAELAADRIISAYDAEEYIDDCASPEKDGLSVWICKMIHDADRDIPIAVAALARIDEYHLMMLGFKECEIYNLDEACQLFLAAFLAAARSIFHKRDYLALWDRLVADGDYNAAELCLIEHAFVEMMHEWRERVPDDEGEDEAPILAWTIVDPALETSDDDDSTVDTDLPVSTVGVFYSSSCFGKILLLEQENEASLVSGLVAADSKRLQAIERRQNPTHPRISWLSADKRILFGVKGNSSGSSANHVKVEEMDRPPSLGSVSPPLRVERSDLDKDNQARLVNALEAASQRLKESARQRSPIYARNSWLSQTSTSMS